MASPLTLDDQNFEEEVIKSEKAVMVDFWAPWCGPCKQFAPLVDELIVEFEGRIKIGKINVDENPVITSRYKVMSVPTVLFFKGGRIVDQVIGAIPKEDLVKKIESIIGG